MHYSYGNEVLAATTAEFTAAIHTSFVPVAEIGGIALAEAYSHYGSELPIEDGMGSEIAPELSTSTISALNALHALTIARRNALSRVGVASPEKHVLAIAAGTTVLNEIVTAQQQIAARTKGQYLDTSLTGQ